MKKLLLLYMLSVTTLCFSIPAPNRGRKRHFSNDDSVNTKKQIKDLNIITYDGENEDRRGVGGHFNIPGRGRVPVVGVERNGDKRIGDGSSYHLSRGTWYYVPAGMPDDVPEDMELPDFPPVNFPANLPEE